MQLTEAIEALLLATRADGRSRRTVESYQEKLSHLMAFLGNVAVEGITVDDLRRYIAYQMSEHVLFAGDPRERIGTLSPFTVAGRVRAVKRLFNWLEEEGQIAANPTRRIKTPRPRRQEPKGISLANIRALLETAKGNALADVRDRAIILFLCDTGCRVGGLCRLRLDDVHLEAGLALVREKGGKSRYAMFAPRTAEAVRAWLAIRSEGGDKVFVSLKRKTGLTPSGVWQMLQRRAEQAGIEGAVNPHSFRHGFARHFLLSGGDLGTLADILGHSSVEVTKAYYGIFTLEELQAKHRRHSPIAKIFEEDEDGNE
jgi:site-specific recombinase XerD